MSYKTKKICRKCSLILFFLQLLQFGYAQKDFTKLNDWMNNHVKEMGGRAVLVIYKKGKKIYTYAANEMTERQKKIATFIAKRKNKNADDMLQDFTEDSKERIASCSKWLSAALVMTFVDEGKLNLEDSIGKFLPVMTLNKKGAIKIWQCLSHLTGINSGSLKESLDEFKTFKTMDDAMNNIASMSIEGEPGKTFRYSNVGLQIAAAIVEKISGKKFEDLFLERIAKPCNMTSTDFGHVAVALPAGGAWSTANDYSNFLQMIINNGSYNSNQVLSKLSIIEMQKNRLLNGVKIMYSPVEAGNWGYGFGEWVIDEFSGVEKSNALSSPGLFGSFPWVVNATKCTGFLMSFNLNNKGRKELYLSLKKIVDETIKD